MKNFLKTVIGIILIFFFLGLITFLFDNTRAAANKRPLFVLKLEDLKDGGTKVYYGIGYKIIAYNKLNGYNKSHIGTYWLKYDDKLGEESELAKLSKENIEKMNQKKLKKVVEFTKKKIVNPDQFFIFLDMVEQKSERRHELNFITITKEGDKINHSLIYENQKMFYTIDRRKDKFATELEKESPITYEVEPLIKTKLTQDKKSTEFYVLNKLNGDEILLVIVPQSQLKKGS